MLSSNAQLMAALEWLLRAHPTCRNYAMTTSSLLLEVHRHGKLVSDIVGFGALSQMLTGLVSTFSKWLLINASPQHHPTLAQQEAFEGQAAHTNKQEGSQELLLSCCQAAFETCLLAIAASHHSAEAGVDAAGGLCSGTSDQGIGNGATCDATVSDAPAGLRSPDQDAAACSDVIGCAGSGASRRSDESLLLVVGKLGGAAARVLDRLLLNDDVELRALARECSVQASGMCQFMPASGVLHALEHAMAASSMAVPEEQPCPWGIEASLLVSSCDVCAGCAFVLCAPSAAQS